MRVLVTGGTGFVGREVVRQAHLQGHAVRILARDPGSAKAKDLQRCYGAEIQEGDVLESSTIEAALAGTDAVIHLVGIISEVGSSTFENMHLRATENLCRAARQAAVNRVVHMSALGTRPHAFSRYHKTKWLAEAAVRQSGLAFTIFRPSLIYGREDAFVNLFARIARFSPVLPVMGSQDALFQPVAVEAVGAALVGALVCPEAIGQTYDLCGPQTFTLSQILGEILEATQRSRLKLPIPTPLARLQARLLELIFPRLLGKAPPFNREQLLMLQENNVGQGSAADELFKLKHPTFQEGIRAYLRR